MITVPIAWVMVRLRSEKAEVIREVTIEIASRALNRPIEHLMEQFAHSSGYISGIFIPR